MVESYSAFGGEGEETGLLKILKDRKITDCYVVGLAWDYCVGSTAFDAAKNGYNTYMIKEATRSVNDATKETMNTKIKQGGVKLISLNDFTATK